MTEKRLKRPRDPFQFAKLIGDIATGQVEDSAPPAPVDPNKDAAAVALGRKGGLKGPPHEVSTSFPKGKNRGCGDPALSQPSRESAEAVSAARKGYGVYAINSMT